MRLRRKKREKKEALDLDITSLLDVLVILLVFLLKSYNASNLRVDPKANIRLPDSKSEKLGEHALIVQVNKDGLIWVNNQQLGDSNQFHSANIDKADGKLTSLYQEILLHQEKEQPNKESSEKIINLVLDQDLEYERVAKVMHTAGVAGHTKFKFVVKATY